MTALLEQIGDELDRALVGPVRSMLGLDLADALRQRIDARAGLIARQLASDDARLAAEQVIDYLGCVWPHGVTDPAWWRTPAGRLCARSLGVAGEDEAVTHAEAADMLGLHRGTIATMVHRGTLARHPNGGVSRAAVLTRLAATLDADDGAAARALAAKPSRLDKT